MREINFYEDCGELSEILNPFKFKDFMLNTPIAEIIELTKEHSYEDFCVDLCENAVSWSILQFLQNDYSLDNIFVHEGTFNNYHHCWLSVDDYYVDLTLLQFLVDVPELSITKNNEVECFRCDNIDGENKESLYHTQIKTNARVWAIERFNSLI